MDLFFVSRLQAVFSLSYGVNWACAAQVCISLLSRELRYAIVGGSPTNTTFLTQSTSRVYSRVEFVYVYVRLRRLDSRVIMAGLRLTICFMLALIETLSAQFNGVKFDSVRIDDFNDEGKAEIQDVSFIIWKVPSEVEDQEQTTTSTYSVNVTAKVNPDIFTVDLKPGTQDVTASVIGGPSQGGSGVLQSAQPLLYQPQRFNFKASALLSIPEALSAGGRGVLTGNVTATFSCKSEPEDLCGGPSNPSPLDKLLFIETRSELLCHIYNIF